MLSSAHHLYLIKKFQSKNFSLRCLHGIARIGTPVGFLAPAGIGQGFTSSQANPTSVAGNSVMGWVRTVLSMQIYSCKVTGQTHS